MNKSRFNFAELKKDHAFAGVVYCREFSFQTQEEIKIDETNQLDTFTKLDEERDLLAFAQRQGAKHVRIFCNAVVKAAKRMCERSAKEKLALEIFELMDPEFQKYCDQVKNFDWFWSFSDDARVSRLGSRREGELKKLATQSPLHQSVWDFYAKKRSDAIRRA